MLLLPETAPVSETSFASGGRAENGATALAWDHGLSMAENGGDLQTSGTLDVHEVAVWVLDQTLELASASLFGGTRVK